VGLNVLSFLGDDVPEAPSGTGLAATEKKIHSRPDQVRKMIHGTLRALRYFKESPDEVPAQRDGDSLTLGITEYTFKPFIKAGLPVKPLPTPREGTYTTGGSGHLTIVKDPPRPNATKVFVNWLLSKEGQEIFSKSLGQGSRRLDVDTKWLGEVVVAKDFLTPQQFFERENQSEEKVYTVRGPGMKIAQELFR